mmetsp:Transcript_9846/g.31743  ORF Transcript_9846/g.31743 Transcript_9846/m.31743 type:complete len:230 (+) Transcript_9846:291-980(+)
MPLSSLVPPRRAPAEPPQAAEADTSSCALGSAAVCFFPVAASFGVASAPSESRSSTCLSTSREVRMPTRSPVSATTGRWLNRLRTIKPATDDMSDPGATATGFDMAPRTVLASRLRTWALHTPESNCDAAGLVSRYRKSNCVRTPTSFPPMATGAPVMPFLESSSAATRMGMSGVRMTALSIGVMKSCTWSQAEPSRIEHISTSLVGSTGAIGSSESSAEDRASSSRSK